MRLTIKLWLEVSYATYRKLLTVLITFLLTKLKFYGITRTSYNVIKSYLEGRYQRVVLNNIPLYFCFKWVEIKHGVP